MPRRVYVRRIYSLIVEDLSLIGQYRLRENEGHIRWYSKTKTDKYSSFYVLLSLSGQVVYFRETDYYCIILSHYLQVLAEVLQNKCS